MTRAILCSITAAAMLVMVAAPAPASEDRPTLAELESEVMCPTCGTLLEQSDAPIAERMRAFIRTRIEAGDSKSAIKAKLVSDFGRGVLAAPPARGFDLLAWVLPFGILFGAGVAVAVVARRWRSARRTAPAGLGLGAEIPAEMERRLDEELLRFD
jgi:cytochrome c-type biogenesis protein CcmH/NrfF